MTKGRNVRYRIVGHWCLVIGHFLSVPCIAAEEPEIPFELRPYRVRIAVAFGRDARFTPEFRRRLLDEIGTAVRSHAGATWDLSVAEDERLWPPDRRGLERLTVADEQATATDMVFRLVLESSGPLWIISGRQWDATTQRLSPVIARDARDRRAVVPTALDIIGELFAPVLMVSDIDERGETVELRQQAGALLAADEDEPTSLGGPLRAGDLLHVVLRYFDREQRLRQVQPVTWTYLVVQSAERGRVTARVVSGLRSPLGTGSRRRVEIAAVAVRPHFDATRLRLVYRNAPDEPLAGRTLTVVARTVPDDTMDGQPTRRLTDRRGTVRLEADPSQPLVWVTVERGDRPLARVPVVPGHLSAATLELPDDSQRLATAGDLAQLKARLVDTVARRAVLIARIRAAAREGDWAGVDRQMARLDALPDARAFQSDLRTLLAAAGATAGDDAATADITSLVARYLSGETLRTLHEEIAELRRIADAGGIP